MRTWLLQAGSNRYFTHNTYSQAVQLLPTCSHPESGHPRVNLTLTGLQKDLSIQRCYPEVSPHHLLTAELFLQNVREAARRPRFALPPSKAEYRAFVDMLLVPTLVRPDIRAPKIDRFIEHLAQKALGEKMLYQCPLYADHVI